MIVKIISIISTMSEIRMVPAVDHLMLVHIVYEFELLAFHTDSILKYEEYYCDFRNDDYLAINYYLGSVDFHKTFHNLDIK